MTAAATSPRKAIVIASIFTLVGVAFTCALAFWQLERLDWKRGVIEKIETRRTAEPVDLDALHGAMQAGEDLEYARVRLTGHFDHGSEIRIYTSGPQGPGWNLVTRFTTKAREEVFVNRGYVPDALLEEAARPEGTVTVTGLLRPYNRRGTFTPDNDPDANAWYWYEYEAMQTKAYETWEQRNGLILFPYVVEQEPRGDGFPAGGATRIEIPNNHFQYALTWFGLAAALLGVYLVWLRQQLRA
ncbi:SURF1 family protein [Tepidamorphus sp. 3E244]|uniref:SURF1 family protein n=1 Tax=Tepidamorphus sp. 3E244 TaxID=3385498 RepID=UPI0038FC3B1F